MASSKRFGWIEFLTGFAAGSIAASFFTKKEIKSDLLSFMSKAEEVRNELLNRAKNISSELIKRSQKFVESVKKFAEGKYSGTIESLDKEYYSIRYAINSAIDNYRRNSKDMKTFQVEDDLFIDFDEEALPKSLGMGRRKR